jgi:hypothetical protein
MQFSFPSRISLGVIAALGSMIAVAQDSPKGEPQRIPPRAAPTDYQAQAKAGDFTIAAEFTGHSVATPSSILSSEDFVAVEVAIYGPADSRLKLGVDDFSLRINDKKSPVSAVPPAAVFKSLKDPEWEPPTPVDPNKGKTTFGSGGRKSQGEAGSPPPVVHIPVEVERAMAQRVQKAALSEGERTLPEAGLIFFPYHGKAQSIHSVELIYAGAAGKATLELKP